jgi:hypothetical protein
VTLRVKNWTEFQHYRDRDPPWIKLHFSLLSSKDWVTLDDASRVLAIACMLIASRNKGEVPNDPDYIRRVAYLNKAVNFKPLIDCGFLEDASGCLQVLADARPEERREETEADGVAVVFDHWKATHDHPQAKLDQKRSRLISAALKIYSAPQLCEAITGYKRSEFHQGKNKDNKVFDSLALMLRDAEHIDAGIKFAAGGQQRWT